jgi:D-3-phosphoglycerate dehydrogenase/(S)-sulfolactate dehydrogenase
MTPQPRVLITPQFLTPGDDIDGWLREQGCETVHAPYRGPRDLEELIRLFRDVDGAIIASDLVSPAVLDAAPRLRVVARPGVGYDSVDIDAATSRGVAVCNMPAVNASAVAELTIGLMVLCARQIPRNMDDVRAGSWQRIEGRELNGATLGLVGLGSIGRAAAALARGFGMTLLAYDKFPDPEYAETHGVEYVEADELLRRSDFVSLHMLLDASTRHWLDQRRLALMKPTAYLINTSRGPVVDEAALADALRDRTIAGAALDVVEVEPLPTDSPLRSLDNVYITPHLGGVTTEARARSGWGAARSVVDVLQGRRPTNLVNAAVSLDRRLAGRPSAS